MLSIHWPRIGTIIFWKGCLPQNSRTRRTPCTQPKHATPRAAAFRWRLAVWCFGSAGPADSRKQPTGQQRWVRGLAAAQPEICVAIFITREAQSRQFVVGRRAQCHSSSAALNGWIRRSASPVGTQTSTSADWLAGPKPSLDAKRRPTGGGSVFKHLIAAARLWQLAASDWRRRATCRSPRSLHRCHRWPRDCPRPIVRENPDERDDVRRPFS